MAECGYCHQEMTTGQACTWKPAVTVEGVAYERVPYGHDPLPAEGTAARQEARRSLQANVIRPERCHDCNVPVGALHHPGCDVERCPRCAWQAISCGCRWAGEDGPGPDLPESPDARRRPLGKDGTDA